MEGIVPSLAHLTQNLCSTAAFVGGTKVSQTSNKPMNRFLLMYEFLCQVGAIIDFISENYKIDEKKTFWQNRGNCRLNRKVYYSIRYFQKLLHRAQTAKINHVRQSDPYNWSRSLSWSGMWKRPFGLVTCSTAWKRPATKITTVVPRVAQNIRPSIKRGRYVPASWTGHFGLPWLHVLARSFSLFQNFLSS